MLPAELLKELPTDILENEFVQKALEQIKLQKAPQSPLVSQGFFKPVAPAPDPAPDPNKPKPS